VPESMKAAPWNIKRARAGLFLSRIASQGQMFLWLAATLRG